MQKASMRVRVSSSFFCTAASGKLIRMLRIRPSRVVSKATPRPPVRLLMEFLSASGSALSPMASEPTATERPMTVPMKPRIGMAQRKTLSSE